MSTLATRPSGIQGRSQADEAMCRLLRVDAAVVGQGAEAAQRAMSRSIVISAIRCMLTYVVIPVGVPVVHVLGTVGPSLSVALCVAAVYFSISSMRRFWAANHRYRWHYTIVASVVLTYLTFGIVADLTKIL